jgi:hypothetical protein
VDKLVKSSAVLLGQDGAHLMQHLQFFLQHRHPDIAGENLVQFAKRNL